MCKVESLAAAPAQCPNHSNKQHDLVLIKLKCLITVNLVTIGSFSSEPRPRGANAEKGRSRLAVSVWTHSKTKKQITSQN